MTAPYAACDDMVARFGTTALQRLTTPLGSALALDTAAVTLALLQASALADSYIALRRPVPLSTVPDTVKRAVEDLAFLELHGEGMTPSDKVVERARASLAWLKDIGAGKASLGLAPPPPPASSPEATARFGGGTGSRVFGGVGLDPCERFGRGML
jgi:phage gp36-like protein